MPHEGHDRGHGGHRRDDPVAQLQRCHDRMRELATLAGRLGSAEPGSDDEIADAAAEVARFFTVASPRHTADEDESVAPALKEAGAPPDVLAALATMTGEHGPIDQLVAEAAPLWTALASDPGRRGELRPALARLATRLDELLAAHLPPEEAIIFPAVARLPEALRARVSAEMQARRDRDRGAR